VVLSVHGRTLHEPPDLRFTDALDALGTKGKQEMRRNICATCACYSTSLFFP
jgi:hypothetical protein